MTRERSDAGKSVYRISGHPEDETGGVIGMGRTEAKSGQAAKRSMAATSGARTRCADVSCSVDRGGLQGRDLDGLRRQWRAHLGGEARSISRAGSE